MVKLIREGGRAGTMPSYLEGASMSPREGGAMNRGEPPSAVTPSKGLLWRARTPVGGTFHFEISVMPPLTKTCPKMILPIKGVAFA